MHYTAQNVSLKTRAREINGEKIFTTFWQFPLVFILFDFDSLYLENGEVAECLKIAKIVTISKYF